MKCTVVQHRLLSITNPERVPANLRSHLAHCAACREWHNQLVLLERHVPLLPIPTSNGKAKLIRQLLREPIATPSRAAVSSPRSANVPAIRRSHRRILGVAAALLVLALGWVGLLRWLESPISPPRTPMTDALLASLVQRDLRLAQAATPGERIEILADVAEDLHGETNALAFTASEGELTALAKLYEEVVRQGILKQAEAIPLDDRQRTLDPISLRMAQAANRVEHLAQELPAECAEPLQIIAAIARTAHRQLRALVSERKA
jgi:hypothetical protein